MHAQASDKTWTWAGSRLSTISTTLIILATLFAGMIWLTNVSSKADRALDKATANEQELLLQRQEIIPRLERIEGLLMSRSELIQPSRQSKSNKQKNTSDGQYSNASSYRMPERSNK